MPLNCPFQLIPFFAADACSKGCPQYDSERDLCCWFFPPRPVVEILDTEERLLRLERLYSDLLKGPQKSIPLAGEPLAKVDRLHKPKLAGGVKL